MSEKGGSDLDVFEAVSKPPAAQRDRTLLGMQAPPSLARGLPELPPPPSSQKTQRGLPPPPPPPVPEPVSGISAEADASPNIELLDDDALTPLFPPVAGPPTTLDDEQPTPLFPPVASQALLSPDDTAVDAPSEDGEEEELATEVFSTAAVAAVANRINAGLERERPTKPGQPAPPFSSAPPISSDKVSIRKVSTPPPKPLSLAPSVPTTRRTDPGILPPPSRPPGSLTMPRGMKSIPPAVVPPPTSSVPAPKAPPPPAPPGEGWEEDDKTEVYGRSAGQDAARRLLGTTKPRTAAVPDAPPPPMSRPSAPVPTPAFVSARRAATASDPAPEPKSVPPPQQNRKTLIYAAAAALAIVIALILILMPSTGRLDVTVAGPGNRPIDAVEVLLNGEVVCRQSPCQIEDLEAKTHYVQARAAGFQDTGKTSVAISSGQEAVHNFELLPATGTGIRVKARGTGLKLFLDERELGPLPQELKELSPGKYTVRISGEHFETWEEKVQVKADEMQTIGPLNLKVVKGLAMIKDGGNANGARLVLQNGKDRRSLPKLPINLHIETETPHILTATRDGFEPFRTELTFEDGQAERTFKISLVPSETSKDDAKAKPSRAPVRSKKPPTRSKPRATGKGALNFNTIPASKVILDGRPLGNTPRMGVSVSSGRHSVVFLRDNERASKSVTIGVGETKTVTHRF